MRYVGRFAPSPTGPLHLGSLVAAVASYLHARQADGLWLVRIEDIDPPREAPGATDAILRALEALGLLWDGPVLHQSSRFEAYREIARSLLAEGRAFRCGCSRSEIRASAGTGGSLRYPGTCRDRALGAADTALRVRVDPGIVAFEDGLQGAQSCDLATTSGDYVIVRRDALPAYHLAVVADDAEQHVTTVVRGIDLLDSTATHVHLQGVLGLPTPRYFHVPVVVNALGQKLSKQNGAALAPASGATAERVLALLGARVPRELVGAPPAALWEWATGQWRIEGLRGRKTLGPARE